MSGVMEQARAQADALLAGAAAERPAITLVYYDEESWAALNPDEPGTVEEHTKAMDWLARRLGVEGFPVTGWVLRLGEYRQWLGKKSDTRDRRAECAAHRGLMVRASGPRRRMPHGYRLGMKIEPNLIGWAILPLRPDGDVGGKSYPHPDDSPAVTLLTGADIKASRKALGERLRDYAARHGIGDRTLRRIEAGEELPPLSMLLDIVAERECSTPELHGL